MTTIVATLCLRMRPAVPRYVNSGARGQFKFDVAQCQMGIELAPKEPLKAEDIWTA
jgi:hypothetical protein